MEEAGIKVRKATSEDTTAIDEVGRLAVADLRKVYRPTPSAVKRARAQRTTRLVAVLDGRIVGTMRYRPEGDRLHLMGPMVHPDFRRRGVARAIVESVATIARTIGAARLSLFTVVETGNVPIFERMGFKVVRTTSAEDVESVCGLALNEAYMERPIEHE